MDLSYFYTEEGALRTRPQPKTALDVQSVIDKHKGERDDVVDRVLGVHIENLQWEWFDSYLVWEEEHESVLAWNDSVAGTVSHTNTVRSWDEEKEEWVYKEEDVLFDEKPVPLKPPRPTVDVSSWKRINYQILRAAAYPSSGEQMGMQYDDVVEGTSTWVECQEAIKAQYPKA